jgi:hypothetical protein
MLEYFYNDKDWTCFEEIDIYIKKKYCKIIKKIYDFFFKKKY